MQSICDLSNDELLTKKIVIYDSILDDADILPESILKKSLEELLEIERELTRRYK
jgi:hypothetical protein